MALLKNYRPTRYFENEWAVNECGIELTDPRATVQDHSV
jgi:hypothetical protein